MDPLNAEFTRLLSNSGWSQAEAARRLQLTPSAISGYLSGRDRPSLTVLKLFKLMVGDTHPIPGEVSLTAELRDGLRPTESDERQLLEVIRQIPEPGRKQLILHFQAIAGLVQRPLKYPAPKRAQS